MSDYRLIRLVILDVDGTLTDGGIFYDASGNEIKRFDVKDGLGIKVAMAAGLEFAIITGRTSPIVRRRAGELGIARLLEGKQMKYPAMQLLLREMGLDENGVCYIGDDWNDLECMRHAGVKMCPGDADAQVKQVCDYVAKASGGHGAVRECLEELLKGRDQWEKCCGKLYCTQ